MIRRFLQWTVVGCFISGVVWAGSPTTRPRSESTSDKPDRSYGTAIQWESNLELAAKKAERQGKLLMVLAVAGHFEDPGFT